MSESNIPNFAHSIVPAVVGLTNLFCIICCITSPAKARELPDKRILIVLGIRLENKIFSDYLTNEKISY